MNGIRRWLGVLAPAALTLLLLGCPTTDSGDNGDNGNANENGNDNAGVFICEPSSASPTTAVSYADDIRPIFSAAGCLSGGCHGGTLSASGFDMRSYDTLFDAGTEAGQLGLCPIAPGDPDNSYLVEKLRGSPRRGAPMPLVGDPLTAEELELIETWIRDGAPNN